MIACLDGATLGAPRTHVMTLYHRPAYTWLCPHSHPGGIPEEHSAVACRYLPTRGYIVHLSPGLLLSMSARLSLVEVLSYALSIPNSCRLCCQNTNVVIACEVYVVPMCHYNDSIFRPCSAEDACGFRYFSTLRARVIAYGIT